MHELRSSVLRQSEQAVKALTLAGLLQNDEPGTAAALTRIAARRARVDSLKAARMGAADALLDVHVYLAVCAEGEGRAATETYMYAAALGQLLGDTLAIPQQIEQAVAGTVK